MTAPMSQDLRQRIVRAVAQGHSARQAAQRFAVSPSAAVKLMQRVRQTGSTAPAKIGGSRRPLLEPHADTLPTAEIPRLSGWAARGERLVDAAPAGHWKTTTFVAGLRSRALIAPLVLDGPMTGEAFKAYVEQMLAPA